MKLLILGGTRFVGRHLVTAALARKHEVTLFNRGTHSSAALPGVETIHEDRNNDLVKLKGHRWDAVVDTCGWVQSEGGPKEEIHPVGLGLSVEQKGRPREGRLQNI